MAAAADEPIEADAPSAIVNFGGNQTWQARRCQPRDDKDVLAILNRNRSGTIRSFVALHSWSDVAATSGAALDLSALDKVETFTRDGETFVRVGAGCRLSDLLARLHAAGD